MTGRGVEGERSTNGCVWIRVLFSSGSEHHLFLVACSTSTTQSSLKARRDTEHHSSTAESDHSAVRAYRPTTAESEHARHAMQPSRRVRTLAPAARVSRVCWSVVMAASEARSVSPAVRYRASWPIYVQALACGSCLAGGMCPTPPTGGRHTQLSATAHSRLPATSRTPPLPCGMPGYGSADELALGRISVPLGAL